MLRSVQIRLTEIEKLSQSMQQDITSYKAMFERSNLTITAMDQIFHDLDCIGDIIDCLDIFDWCFAGQEREQNITRILIEINKRMRKK
jgi:hypothetical protein